MVGALGNGVIGNTAVSGTVIQGSSPCSPTKSSTNVCEDLRGAGVFFFAPIGLKPNFSSEHCSARHFVYGGDLLLYCQKTNGSTFAQGEK